jgi:ABC-2 type transport system ATP-binding protein
MLEIDGLHKRYGEVTALDGCSFSVDPGRMLGFLGPNGAGKTTTMRAVFGLVRLDAGEVRWNGRPVTGSDLLRFGYMPEQRGLYPKMKAHDQLVYMGRLHGMDSAAAAAAADGLLAELGLTDRAGAAVDDLSHGNQQRVQLAAALIHSPDLLVLDEPFSGLDPMGAETMASVLRRRAADGATVVFSSHQLDLVEDLCDDVAIIHRGRIVLDGEVRALKDRSPHRIVEIEVDESGADLLGSLDDVISSSFDGHRHRLVVPASEDVTHLLTSNGASRAIRHFAYTTPSLTDLFKEAVA